MVKTKKQEETARKSHKKSKKHSSKINKDAPSEEEGKKFSSIKRKQTELARVLQLKCAMLLQGNLSYLEYMELREELCRLNSLKETFAKQTANYEKR